MENYTWVFGKGAKQKSEHNWWNFTSNWDMNINEFQVGRSTADGSAVDKKRSYSLFKKIIFCMPPESPQKRVFNKIVVSLVKRLLIGLLN